MNVRVTVMESLGVNRPQGFIHTNRKRKMFKEENNRFHFRFRSVYTHL